MSDADHRIDLALRRHREIVEHLVRIEASLLAIERRLNELQGPPPRRPWQEDG